MTELDLGPLLDELEPQMRQHYLTIIERLRRRNRLDEVARMVEARRYEEAIAGVDQAAEELSAEFRVVFLLVAAKVADMIRSVAPDGFAFDVTNWRVVTLFQGIERDLVNLFRTDLRTAIAGMVVRGTGVSPAGLVNSLGLSAQDAGNLETYRRALTDSQRTQDRGRLRERTVVPLGSEARTRMLAARLAALRAAQAVRMGLWLAQLAIQTAADIVLQMAVEFGALAKDTIKRIWLTEEDPLVRDSHEPMQDQPRRLGEPFKSGAGVSLMYPGDPRAPAKETRGCRCRLRLTVSF